MPPLPRRQLPADFRKAVYADPRGICRLSQLAGFPAYTHLIRVLRKNWINVTPLGEARLRALAAAIGFTGEVFRGR